MAGIRHRFVRREKTFNEELVQDVLDVVKAVADAAYTEIKLNGKYKIEEITLLDENTPGIHVGNNKIKFDDERYKITLSKYTLAVDYVTVMFVMHPEEVIKTSKQTINGDFVYRLIENFVKDNIPGFVPPVAMKEFNSPEDVANAFGNKWESSKTNVENCMLPLDFDGKVYLGFSVTSK